MMIDTAAAGVMMTVIGSTTDAMIAVMTAAMTTVIVSADTMITIDVMTADMMIVMPHLLTVDTIAVHRHPQDATIRLPEASKPFIIKYNS
jgi:hypothetical protein